jgi:hypothetical protein
MAVVVSAPGELSVVHGADRKVQAAVSGAHRPHPQALGLVHGVLSGRVVVIWSRRRRRQVGKAAAIGAALAAVGSRVLTPNPCVREVRRHRAPTPSSGSAAETALVRSRVEALVVHPVLVARLSEEQDLEALGQELMELQQPGEVVRAAGAWLSVRLRAEGFAWLKSQGTLQRRDHDRREQLFLQSSKWNRSGGPIEFSSVLNVCDRGLKKWRQAHPEQAVRSGDDDSVCGHPFGDSVGTFVRGVNLTSSDRRVEELENFVERIRTIAIPWFASTSDPAALVKTVPDQTLELFPAELLEWLVSRMHSALARPLVDRWLGLDPAHPAAFEAGRERGLRGEEPPEVFSRESLGWSCAVLAVE